MGNVWIEEVHLENFGCIRNATLRFPKPLHALIGPNDSGKSTVLAALRSIADAVAVPSGSGPGKSSLSPDGPPRQSDFHRWFSPKHVAKLHAKSKLADFTLKFGSGAGDLQRTLSASYPPDYRKWTTPLTVTHLAKSLAERIQNGAQPVDVAKALWAAAESLGSSRLLRLDPDALRKPSKLIAPGRPLDFADEHGTGLAALIDAIRDRDDGRYEKIREDVVKLFPNLKRIRLERTREGEKEIAADLDDGTMVPAAHLSEGLLYFLAFKAVQYADPVALLLIEEPENGLHPARIADVVKVLRAIAEEEHGPQVIMATHSPLVINELTEDEVTVVTRTQAEGTKVCLLRDTANFELRSKVYANGELWLSYADGKQEEALIQGGPEAP